VDFLTFFFERRSEIGALAAQHLLLVAISTAIAAALGIPMGILLARRPRLAPPILGLANAIQTVPSLALLGFLIPLPVLGGIGTSTTTVALVLYALLPIVRNTYTGLRSVDPAVIESGRGMGMTAGQLLWMVELPLSLTVILAGVRIATVVSVGIATIAAAIGAGGLGELIFRGVAMLDNRLIIAGALPAALMALAADFLLGLTERALAPRRAGQEPAGAWSP